MGKSTIKKSIVRQINTAKFEQVTITVEIAEDIEWKDKEERKSKIINFTDFLLSDFTETYNQVVEKLGIDRCIGAVTTTAKPSGDGKKNKTKASGVDQDDFDFLGD